MILKCLKIRNFRNYESADLQLNDKINIIYGKNGQGKSNLLESIHVLSLTKSHRISIDQNLIKEGENFSKIQGKIVKGGYETNLQVLINKDQKKIKVNSTSVKKVSDYISNLSVIMFYPEDLDIIKGPPSIRRKILDDEISKLNSSYYIIFNQYKKLIKLKNEYLKEKSLDLNYLSVINDYLTAKSLKIYKIRQKFIDRLNEYISIIYEDIMHTKNLKVVYKTEIKEDLLMLDEKKLRTYYSNVEQSEIKFCKSLFGPHHDDILFYIENREMKSFASQGQKRAAILALKLSFIEIFKKYKKENPVLLLDDVFSELDENKRKNLIKYLSDNIQTIITTTDLNCIEKQIIKKAKVIEIINGKIEKQEEV